MAYGDNRSSVASDTFDSTIDGSWTNGPGDWPPCDWWTGGHVTPTNTGIYSNIKRNTGTYVDDQYSQTIVHSYVVAADCETWTTVRMQVTDTDEACYGGVWTTDPSGDGHQFRIFEVNNSYQFTDLASSGVDQDNPSQGDILTTEVEGTTIRMGDNINGADAQRVTTTDATISSGRPGLVVFTFSGDEDSCNITSWDGGNISAVPIFDAASSTSAKEVSTVAWNHTCTGSDRVLVVGCGAGQSGSISSATYNSVSMTPVGSQVGGVRQFYLIAPATGSNEVSISVSGDFFVAGAVSVTSAHQTSPIDTFGGTTGSNSHTLTTTEADTFGVDVTYYDGEGSASTVGAGQTQRWSLSIESHPGQGSTEVFTSSGSNVMSWTGGDSSDVHAVAIAGLSAAAGPITGSITFDTTVDQANANLKTTLENQTFAASLDQLQEYDESEIISTTLRYRRHIGFRYG